MRRPEAWVLLAAFLWSSGGVGVKSIDAAVPPLAIAGLRGAFAAAVMGAVAWWTTHALGVSWQALLRRRFVWSGALAYAATVVSFVLAARMTTATNAILIQYTGPVYVALFGWPLLRERPKALDWLAIVGCLVGLLVCVSGELGAPSQGPHHKLGLLFAFVSSVGFAGIPLSLRLDARAAGRTPCAQYTEEQSRTLTPLWSMALGNGLAACCLLLEWPAVRALSGHDLGIAALLGVFQIAIPYVLYGQAASRLSALKSSLLAFVEPVLTPVWVFFGVGERPSASALLGGVIILAALALQSQKRVPAAPPPPAPTPA